MTRSTLSRRGFLGAATGLVYAAGSSTFTRAGDQPPVTNPRATSGDDLHEPDWDERLTISVGPKNADILGQSDKPIQAAVDYVARLGGGTVRLVPGTYTFRNAVYLSSHVRLVGAGNDTVLVKNPSNQVKLTADSDWYDQEITLEPGHGFEVGDGICLQARNPHNGSQEVIKRTLVSRSGDRFKLDRALRKNLWLSGEPTAANLFPLLSGERNSDVVIENLTLDGNRANNANLNGNYAGCIFLQDCNRYHIRNVTAHHYNGDGISWQICHDVIVENCHSHDNAGLGLHPGSGSQRPVMRSNKLDRNNLGLFFCWGVKFGLAEKNTIDGNQTYGISIGHCDTDNVIRDNTITNSGKVGILFRDADRGQDFWPHRNRVERNRIIDSGSNDGIAIDVQGRTRDVTIARNELRETRGPSERTGIRVGAETRGVQLSENRLEGFAVDVVDNRTA